MEWKPARGGGWRGVEARSKFASLLGLLLELLGVYLLGIPGLGGLWMGLGVLCSSVAVTGRLCKVAVLGV